MKRKSTTDWTNNRQAHIILSEKVNKEEKILDDGGVETVILLAQIKVDVIESNAVEVEVMEVFEMLDVTLVAMEAAVAVLSAAWV